MSAKIQQKQINTDALNPEIVDGSKLYDVNRMIFQDVITSNVPDSTITYQRIPIFTLNEDKSVGPLIISTEELFSFGLTENLDTVSKKLTGYNWSVVLEDRKNPQENEKMLITNLDNITERCKKHIISVRNDIGEPDLEERDLRKMSIVYRKKNKETGKLDENANPTLNAKVYTVKKKNKNPDSKDPEFEIRTLFYDTDNNPITNPIATLLNVRCRSRSGIKIESIYIGSGRITIQVKLYETIVRFVQNNTMKPLLNRAKIQPNTTVTETTATNLNDATADEDDGVIVDDEPEKPVVKKVVRKVVSSTKTTKKKE